MSDEGMAATDIDWMIDESQPLGERDIEQLDAAASRGSGRTRKGFTPTLAVTLHDVVIHDNRKWFGEAEIRLDTLVITGCGDEADPTSFYRPSTQRFPRVRDGQSLQIDEERGMLIFHGPVRNFLDVFILASRDRKDSDDLASLLSPERGAGEVVGAVSALAGLVVAAPQALIVKAALDASVIIGQFAYRALSTATGSTIGIYRGSLLEKRDQFAIGPHPAPPQSVFHKNDLSFRYEVNLE